MAVTLFAARISWPIKLIEKAFTITSIGLGAYGIAKDVTEYGYAANVDYNKEVEVKNTYAYRAGRTIKGKALVGDKRASYVYGSERADYDYNDNNSLLKRGIDNYIRFN